MEINFELYFFNKIFIIEKTFSSFFKRFKLRFCSQDYVVKYWLAQGAPAEKIILGTAFYGKSYTLANPKEIGRGAPFINEGKIGTPSYSKVCQLVKNPEWKRLYDNEQNVPYIYNGDQIVAYDDVQ